MLSPGSYFSPGTRPRCREILATYRKSPSVASVTSVRCFSLSTSSRTEAASSTSAVPLCPPHVVSGPRVHPNDFSLFDEEGHLDGFAGFEFRRFLHVVRAIPPDPLGGLDDFQKD